MTHRATDYDALTASDPLLAGRGELLMYAMRNAVTGLTKIGVSFDVARRRRSLETAGGVRLALLYVVRGPESRILAREARLHLHFAAERTIGEWFRLSEAQIDGLPKLMERRPKLRPVRVADPDAVRITEALRAVRVARACLGGES